MHPHVMCWMICLHYWVSVYLNKTEFCSEDDVFENKQATKCIIKRVLGPPRPSTSTHKRNSTDLEWQQCRNDFTDFLWMCNVFMVNIWSDPKRQWARLSLTAVEMSLSGNLKLMFFLSWSSLLYLLNYSLYILSYYYHSVLGHVAHKSFAIVNCYQWVDNPFPTSPVLGMRTRKGPAEVSKAGFRTSTNVPV